MRTVLVAPGDFFYGFARMYALVQVIYGAAKVDTVRSWEEAAKVLGIDLRAAEAWAEKRALSDEAAEVTKIRRVE